MEIKKKDPFMVKDTIESFFSELARPYKVLYTVLLLLFTSMVISIFIIRVPVTVTSRGLTRPLIETVEIRSPLSGRILSVCKAEGDSVVENESVIKMDVRQNEIELDGDLKRLSRIKTYIEDLSGITENNSRPPVSGKYRFSLRVFETQVKEMAEKKDHLTRQLERISVLHNSKMIAEQEFETLEHKLELLVKETEAIREKQYLNWMSELESYTEEAMLLETRIDENKVQIGKGDIKAAFRGTIQDIRSIHKGSHVNTGDLLCRIVPDTILIGEIMVNAGDVRWIRQNMKIRLKLDSHHSQSRGNLEARCGTLPADHCIINDHIFYRVFCFFDETCPGSFSTEKELISGLPFTASFEIGKVRLSSLLLMSLEKAIDPRNSVTGR